METSVALSVFHVSVVVCPASMEFGFAESDAVGEGGGGGGGVVATGFFFAQPVSRIAASAPIMTTELLRVRFNSSSIRKTGPCRKIFYFQLQFGCVFLPAVVSACCFEPSASIVQICSAPPRRD